jgi:hypothetical protein
LEQELRKKNAESKVAPRLEAGNSSEALLDMKKFSDKHVISPHNKQYRARP